MNIGPTLEGGLRIDAENPVDWQQLQLIAHDAQRRKVDLAFELGRMIDEPLMAEDWTEYVVPDLREIFDEQISLVAKAIEEAMTQSNGGAGSVWITRANGPAWYGALNQARLALEDAYHFSRIDDDLLENLPPASRYALIRNDDYSTIQYLLLKYVMR